MYGMELYHHGVKGMKWGVVHDRKEKTISTSSKDWDDKDMRTRLTERTLSSGKKVRNEYYERLNKNGKWEVVDEWLDSDFGTHDGEAELIRDKKWTRSDLAKKPLEIYLLAPRA